MDRRKPRPRRHLPLLVWQQGERISFAYLPRVRPLVLHDSRVTVLTGVKYCWKAWAMLGI